MRIHWTLREEVQILKLTALNEKKLFPRLSILGYLHITSKEI